jgi:hypothetical protein
LFFEKLACSVAILLLMASVEVVNTIQLSSLGRNIEHAAQIMIAMAAALC